MVPILERVTGSKYFEHLNSLGLSLMRRFASPFVVGLPASSSHFLLSAFRAGDWENRYREYDALERVVTAITRESLQDE